MSSKRRTLTLVVMCVGMFLVLLDVTVVNVALPRLRTDLGASVGSLQWIVDGYAVALASLMLPCGDLGDRHGHKRGTCRATPRSAPAWRSCPPSGC
ncbi:MAG TPA: MFS transporter [Solirubrobacteraceae bacterium]